jgi:hypothetical protein
MAILNFRRGHAASRAQRERVRGDMSAPMIEPSTGPGWYDSSWALRCGLVVREGLPADAQLHEWLEQHLRSGSSLA